MYTVAESTPDKGTDPFPVRTPTDDDGELPVAGTLTGRPATLSQTVWPQSKSCSCYFEIFMRIQRNLGSAAVNVFDTKIEMPPLHESVSRSVAAKYIRRMFMIQQAENKPRLSRRRQKISG